MMQNPDGTMTRLPYPGEPGYGGGGMNSVPGKQMPGMGYDQYLPMVRQRMMAPPARVRMPRPVPRFPTPGRMDGMREAKPKTPRGMMDMGMGGAMMPPMMGMGY
ncbi:MAG: hypothetical protein ACO3ND_08845 [Opitutales bacterium]